MRCLHLNSFCYASANTLSEALLCAKDPQAYYLAGGTDLLIKIKNHKIKPNTLVDLKKLSALHGLHFSEQRAEIGALTTIRNIETSEEIIDCLNILSSAAGKLGSVQVRNRATIGGNICNAAPSAETAPALLCLEAELKIIGTDSERQIPIDRFFVGPGQTVLEKGEIMSKIIIKLPPPTAHGVYHKLSVRQAMDIAFVGVAVLLDVVDGVIVNAKIGLGAVAPVPMRA